MKDKKKRQLPNKLKDKITQLTAIASDDGAPTLGVELRSGLEKTYENYLLAEARLNSARNEYMQAKGNTRVDDSHAVYRNCVAKLRHMAGLPGAKLKSIRESIRDNTFPLEMRNALRCDLLENWPLKSQIEFLDSIAGLSEAQKSVRIYAAAYGLYRHDRAFTL